MTSPLDTGNRWAVLGVTVFLLSASALIADQARAYALVNESPSLPRGLYLRQVGAPPGPGAVVALTQPPVARRYLGGLGMPAQVLLIKRVAAGPGEAVCRRGATLHTPRREVQVLDRDRRGTVLPAWRDCRRMGPGEVFLLGDTVASFDSRYFGPVATTALDGVYQEVLTW